MTLRPDAFSPRKAAAITGAANLIASATLFWMTGADYAQAFQPPQFHALAPAFLSAQSSGFTIAMVIFTLGSTVCMYLLVRSRYVPKALAVFGFVGSAVAGLYFLARIVFPAFVAAAAAAARGLTAVALASLAVIFVPIFLFEVTLGLWLLPATYVISHTRTLRTNAFTRRQAPAIPGARYLPLEDMK
jgi:hypothetical protein